MKLCIELCYINAPVSTGAHATPTTVLMPVPGSTELKPSPDMGWQKQAIATLQMYTSIPFVDRTSAPEPRNSAECAEIFPHLDKCAGDGHCGFRALSKSITGTEANHGAFRAAVVAFMRPSCSGRRRPWLVNTKSIDDYIQQTKIGMADRH